MIDILCGTCHGTFQGTRTAHCGGCHETFSSTSAFDAHQRGQYPDICQEPSSVGLIRRPKAWGFVWGYAGNYWADEDER